MSAGDTCYLRAGTYVGHVNLKHGSGGAACGTKSGSTITWCTLRGYPGETAVLQYASGTDEAGTIWLYDDYADISYLTILGKIKPACDGCDSGLDTRNQTGLALHHNFLHCIGVGNQSTNQPILYYGETNSDSINHADVHVYENYFYSDGACQPLSATDQQHFIVTYATEGMIIEHNDFVVKTGSNQSVDSAVFFKSRNGTARVRYNYVVKQTPEAGKEFNCFQQGGQIAAAGGAYGKSDNYFYQNICENGRRGIAIWGDYLTNDKFYNNTFYTTETRAYHENGIGPTDAICEPLVICNPVRGLEAFNNIYYGNYTSWFNWPTQPIGSMWAYKDNEFYYSPSCAGGQSAGTCPAWSERSQNDTDNLGPWTIANWRSQLASDTNPTNPTTVRETSSKWNQNPMFVNVGGHDFHLQTGSPALSGGRGGSYAQGMGAYITGSESIGCTFDPACHAYPAGGPQGVGPATVTGATRTDQH